jgi:signal peptidase I
VHWAAGRWRRALVWDALALAAILRVFWLDMWPALVVGVAQIIDAALIKPVRSRSIWGYLLMALVVVCVGIVITVPIRSRWVESYIIPSGSMIPTLLPGDRIMADKRVRRPGRGDVVIFTHPSDADKDLVKRVVAVAGDTLQISDDVLFLNGAPVARAHVNGVCEYYDIIPELGTWDKRSCDAWDETIDGHTYRVIFDARHTPGSSKKFTVPPDSYFVIGDNRDNSSDSRYWGFVPQANIKGVAYQIWFSHGPNGVRWQRHGTRVR